MSAGIATASAPPAPPDFGPNVTILDPSMSQSQIQASVDAIAAAQVTNEFGPRRDAIYFKPGTYGTTSNPLVFQVGYYTDVAGLGQSPTDVTITGGVQVYNRCLDNNETSNCIGLTNFWRSLSNLTINPKGGITNALGEAAPRPSWCVNTEFWAVSQAASMRRVNVNGGTSFMDYCSAGPQYGSGGFLADSQFSGGVTNGSQQQWFTRNTKLGSWSNAVWNQVFAGVVGAPVQSFPTPPYTTLATNPESREKPFLYLDSNGKYRVYVPDAQLNSSGTTWSGGQTPGHSISIDDFFIAKPGDSVQTINNALARGKNLIFTPGIYNVSKTIEVKRPDTIVLGMGLATIVPQHGVVPMEVADVKGVEISDLIFDAGPVNSPVLLQVGTGHASNGQAREHNHWSDPSDPSGLQDVYFRIGGAGVGKATVGLEVNADNVILDNLWIWRADHGTGVGWTSNTADTGLIVNGDNVVATGLFVEHFQKDETIWNGQNGKIIFFQNEMPYDPPSQAAWTQPDGTLGYPAVRVTNNVKTFQAWGMGSYSFFNQGVNIYSANGFVVPTTLAAGSVKDSLTIFLSTAGFGGILNVVNGVGGSSTIANPDTVVPVVSYP
jgi:hypothetical protein